MQNEANFHSCLPAGGILQIRQETLVSGPNYLILVLDFWFLGVPGLAIFCPFSSLENLEDYWYNNRENISLFVAAFHKLSFLCKAFASVVCFRTCSLLHKNTNFAPICWLVRAGTRQPLFVCSSCSLSQTPPHLPTPQKYPKEAPRFCLGLRSLGNLMCFVPCGDCNSPKCLRVYVWL